MRDIRELAAQYADDDIERGIDFGTIGSQYERAVMFGLQLQGHIYGGTGPLEVIARRRAKNRHARRARRGNTAAIATQARINHAHNSGRRFARGQAPDPFGNLAVLYGAEA